MNVLKMAIKKFEEFVFRGALKENTERDTRLAEGWFIEGYAHGFEAAQMPPAPMECKTDAEKIAYSYGWFKALELNPARKLWVGLTDEDRLELYKKFTDSDEWTYEKAIEARLKEKNT